MAILTFSVVRTSPSRVSLLFDREIADDDLSAITDAVDESLRRLMRRKRPKTEEEGK